MKKGIDISKYNGNIDFTKVKEQVDFVIIRSSIGVPSTNSNKYGTDTYFRKNADGCVNNGIPFGVYHYSTAVSENQAREEAQTALASIKGYKLDYPIYIDLEDDILGNNLVPDTISDIAIAFCEEIKKAGYKAGIYTNKYWLESKLNYNKIKDYPIWLAQWSSKPTWNGKYEMWQYTSDGTINGINGRVDMDYYYGDTAEQPTEKTDDKTSDTSDTSKTTTTYTVVSGDTMYGISQKFGISLAELEKANPQIENYNLIYSGQIINIPIDTPTEYTDISSCSAGTKIELVNEPLYSAANEMNFARKISGTFYFYDGININGFYRITNSKERVGAKPIGNNVTGFIKR